VDDELEELAYFVWNLRFDIDVFYPTPDFNEVLRLGLDFGQLSGGGSPLRFPGLR